MKVTRCFYLHHSLKEIVAEQQDLGNEGLKKLLQNFQIKHRYRKSFELELSLVIFLLWLSSCIYCIFKIFVFFLGGLFFF